MEPEFSRLPLSGASKERPAWNMHPPRYQTQDMMIKIPLLTPSPNPNPVSWLFFHPGQEEILDLAACFFWDFSASAIQIMIMVLRSCSRAFPKHTAHAFAKAKVDIAC